MRSWAQTRNGLQIVGAILLIASTFGCSSSANFETLQSKMAEIELQLLQLRKDTPSKTDLAALDETIREQTQALLKAQADLGSEMREVAAQVENLEAKLEDTNFRLTTLSQQIAATQQELQEIRTAAERAKNIVQQPTTTPRAASNSPTDPQEVYDTAYADYGRGNYDLAILEFKRYLETFPDTELADNATYWIGECYYHQSKFQQAIDQFDEVLTRYERSERVPSALLKKGYAYLELGQRAQGVVQLQNVICEHGGTDEERLARQRLQELGIDVKC